MKYLRKNAKKMSNVACLWVIFFSLFLLKNNALAEEKHQAREIYTIYNVKVDETSSSAEKAQEKALISGRRAAFYMLFSKILKIKDISKLPYFNNSQIEELSTGFAVAHEKRSNVRYMADLSYYFDQIKIHDIFSLLDISSSELISPPALVLPIMKENGEYLIWSDANIWRAKWQDYKNVNKLVDFNLLPNNSENNIALSSHILEQEGEGKADSFSWQRAIEGQRDVVEIYQNFFNQTPLNNNMYIAHITFQRAGQIKDMRLALFLYALEDEKGKQGLKLVLQRFYSIDINKNNDAVSKLKIEDIKIINDNILKINEHFELDEPDESNLPEDKNLEIIKNDPLTLEELNDNEINDFLELEAENLIEDESINTPVDENGAAFDYELQVLVTELLLAKAQRDITHFIDEKWKDVVAVDFNKSQELHVVSFLKNSKTWFEIKNRLNKLSFVAAPKLLNLNIKKANFSFKYVGNLSQLALDMKQHGLKLERLLTEEQQEEYNNKIAKLKEFMPSYMGGAAINEKDIQKPEALGSWSVSLSDEKK